MLAGRLSENTWDSVLWQVYSSSMCARHSLIQFKVVHQAHMSKVKTESTQKLALHVLGVNVQMPHLDRPQSGALLVICRLFETVSAVFEHRLEPDPQVMLFGVTHRSLLFFL